MQAQAATEIDAALATMQPPPSGITLGIDYASNRKAALNTLVQAASILDSYGRRDRNRTCNLRFWRPLLCLIELPAYMVLLARVAAGSSRSSIPRASGPRQVASRRTATRRHARARPHRVSPPRPSPRLLLPSRLGRPQRRGPHWTVAADSRCRFGRSLSMRLRGPPKLMSAPVRVCPHLSTSVLLLPLSPRAMLPFTRANALGGRPVPTGGDRDGPAPPDLAAEAARHTHEDADTTPKRGTKWNMCVGRGCRTTPKRGTCWNMLARDVARMHPARSPATAACPLFSARNRDPPATAAAARRASPSRCSLPIARLVWHNSHRYLACSGSVSRGQVEDR